MIDVTAMQGGNVSKPSLWIVSLSFGGHDQRQHEGSAVSTSIETGEKPRRAPESIGTSAPVDVTEGFAGGEVSSFSRL